MSNIESAFCRSAPWRGFARRVVLPWVLKDTEIGPEILEIGGGSGAMAQEVLMRNEDVRLTLAEIDPAMVAEAAKRLVAFSGRASAVLGDATSLGFESDSFDTVCSWLMLHHTIKWRRVLAEAARVTRPGGSIIGYDLVDTAPSRLIHRLDGSEFLLIDPAELESELRNLGLTEVVVKSGLGGIVMRFSAVKPAAV